MADVVARFKGDTSDLDTKLKNATKSLLKIEESCQKVGGTMAVAEKEDIAFAKSLGQMETQAKTAKGKIAELKNAFTETSLVYKRMTDEEKASPYGQGIAKSVSDLKGRLQRAQADFADVQKSLGGNMNISGLTDYKSVLTEIGGQLGINSNLMGMVTTGTIAYTAAIGGAVAAVGMAAKAWDEYNTQLAKQDQVTKVTIGIDGGDVQKITDYARSLVDVYDVDFREAINGINTLMQQFGVSADDAMNIMSKGMQGMIEGDGPKMLQMIQQYAPAFRDAGISASELVAVIHNTEGGIFTDQNMAAITMGIKNIRLMKDTTKEALKSIGVDADDMSKKLNDGTMTVFEALRQVSEAVQNVGSGSQKAGEVMNDIFGRQGVAAGTNLGKAIATLNTNLDETSKQTGEVGVKMAALQKANEDLQESLRGMFGVASEGWEEFKIDLETKAVQGVTTLIDNIYDIADAVTAQFPAVNTLIKLLGLAKSMMPGASATVDMGGTIGKIASDLIKQTKPTRPTKPTKNTTTTTGGGKSTTEVYKSGELGDYEKDLQELQKKQKHATSTEGWLKLQEQIDATQKKINEIKGFGELDNLNEELRKFQEQQKHVNNNDEWLALQKNIDSTQKKIDAIKAKPVDMAVGLSGLNTKAIDSYVAMVRDALSNADLGTELYNSLTSNLADANAFANVLKECVNNGIDIASTGIDAQSMWDNIVGGADISDSDWQSLVDKINEKLKELNIDPIKLTVTGSLAKDGKETKEAWQDVASAVASVGSAMQGIEDPTVRIAGIIGEAIANVALTFAKSLKGTVTPWDWIAAAAAGTATMISTIASIKSATEYHAQGGFVGSQLAKGTDTVPAMLTPGELVLNKSQQSNLASQLESNNAFSNLHLETTIREDKLIVMLNNGLRKRGRGTLVTTR